MHNTIIEVSHASKNFRNQEVLQDVSVTIDRKKITGIIGRNGSGKTVLLKCIIGIMPLDGGKIVVDGKTIGHDVDFAPNVGFIVDSPGFLTTLSARKNLRYLAAIRGVASNERIDEVIRLVGLDPDDKKHVGKYSMGMRQRLGLAQALMEKPEILILDEPMNGLDNRGVRQMRELLLSLKEEGETIVITSHNHEDIRLLCEAIYEMDEGILLPTDRPSPTAD